MCSTKRSLYCFFLSSAWPSFQSMESKLLRLNTVPRCTGILSLAVALIHSYTFHEHELRVAEVARSIGFTNVSLSSQIMPMVRLVPRGFTASVSLLAFLQDYLWARLNSLFLSRLLESLSYASFRSDWCRLTLPQIQAGFCLVQFIQFDTTF